VNHFKSFLEEATLDEAPLQTVLELSWDYTSSFPKGVLKRTEAEELKREWDLTRAAVRKVVKPLGGLMTTTTAPSPKSPKKVGSIVIGTRGDAGRLDSAKIKAALAKEIDVGSMTVKNLGEDLEEKYTKPTAAEIKKDQDRERKASGYKKPSMTDKSARKRMYGESTKAYAASLERMANDKKLKDISDSDRKTLAKLADLMKKANK